MGYDRGERKWKYSFLSVVLSALHNISSSSDSDDDFQTDDSNRGTWFGNGSTTRRSPIGPAKNRFIQNALETILGTLPKKTLLLTFNPKKREMFDL